MVDLDQSYSMKRLKMYRFSLLQGLLFTNNMTFFHKRLAAGIEHKADLERRAFQSVRHYIKAVWNIRRRGDTSISATTFSQFSCA